MTTVYRNAASVAEARVLELTAQWENSLKAKNLNAGSMISGTSNEESSRSSPSHERVKGDGERMYPYPESAEREGRKGDKGPS